MPAIQEKIIRPVDEKHGNLILSPRESPLSPLSRPRHLMTSHRARSGTAFHRFARRDRPVETRAADNPAVRRPCSPCRSVSPVTDRFSDPANRRFALHGERRIPRRPQRSWWARHSPLFRATRCGQSRDSGHALLCPPYDCLQRIQTIYQQLDEKPHQVAALRRPRTEARPRRAD